MASLRDLFHQPTDHTIGGQTFTVYKLQFDQFALALVLARYLEGLDLEADASAILAKLEGLAQANSAEGEALRQVLAGCLTVSVPGDEARQQQLQAADIGLMPIPMVAEAIAVVLEVNADFFSQTLPRLLQAGMRLQSTGLALLSRSSAPGTLQTA